MLSACVSELLPSFYLEFFAEKKSFRLKKQLSLFCRNVRENFGTSGKKQNSSEKVSWELRKPLSLLPKRMLEKREHFFGKKSASMKLSDPSKNSDFLSEHFFSNFFGRQFRFFGVNFEVIFLVKNFFGFSSI